MTDSVYGVTKQGFIRKPLEKIINDLNSKFIAEFGSSFDVTPESPDGQIIGIIADKISQCWDLAQGSYNSYRPGATQGVGLDAIVELNRITRIVNKPTEVTCVMGGDNGVLIPAGSIVATSDGQYEFTTNNDITIPNAVTATCTVTGEIPILANSVTSIISQIDGWTSVNNPGNGITGIDYESDPQLRARREKSTIVTGTNTTEAIYDALSSMSLQYVRVRDNDTTQSIGSQPANSFHTVVVGGTDYDIAKAIYDNKPSGIKAYGSTVVKIKDSKGYDHDIGFSRPTNIDVFVNLTYKRYAGSSNDTTQNILSALSKYINGLSPGESVIWSKLFAPVMLTNNQIEIDSLTIGTSATALSTDTITMDIYQRAYVDSTTITITDIT